MIKKTELNKKAVALRKKGLTYSAIMDQVPVAKSTLALWFKEVKLSKPQIQKITKARLAAGLRGAARKRQQRIAKMQRIIWRAERQIGRISRRELWLIGTAIYWAEGTKEKERKPGTGVQFINMDANMIEMFLRWLKLCGINKKNICFDLYIHENHKNRENEIKKYWANVTGFPVAKFTHVYWKKNNPNTKRKRVGKDYFGITKIMVKQSSTFLRQITGWINGLTNGINYKQLGGRLTVGHGTLNPSMKVRFLPSQQS